MPRKGNSKPAITIHTWRDVPRAEGEYPYNADGELRRSLTIPDQVKTIEQIVNDFTRGITDLPDSDLFFLNDEEIPNFESMSKIDQLDAASQVRHIVAKRREILEQLKSEGKQVPDAELKNLSPIEPVIKDSLEEEIPS